MAKMNMIIITVFAIHANLQVLCQIIRMKAQTSKEKLRASTHSKLHKWPLSTIPIIAAI